MDFTPVAIIIVVPLVVMLLMRPAKPNAITVDGRTEVAYGWGYKGMALLSGLVTLAPVIGVFFVRPEDRVWLLGIALVFGIPATYLLLEGFFARIVYSDQGIEVKSPWRKNRFVPWDEVRRFRYWPGAQWHLIETARSGDIRVNARKSGVATLLQEFKNRGIRNY